MPQLTKERIYLARPDYYGPGMIKRHINRYKWAMGLVKEGGTVLDAACGSGYGGHILLNRCQNVMGVDICEEAVSYAQVVAKQKGLEDRLVYGVENVADLPFAKDTFDSVVSIETIEHLDDVEQGEAIEGFLRVMKPDGNLIITTPIHNQEKKNEFHKQEFNEAEFDDFLKRHFREIKYFNATEFCVPQNFILAECRGPRK